MIPSKTSLDRAYIYIPFDDFKFILYSDRRRESVTGGEGFRAKKRETWKERRRFENKNIGKERRETVNGRCVCVCVCMYVNSR